jgi:hypothetical protein
MDGEEPKPAAERPKDDEPSAEEHAIVADARKASCDRHTMSPASRKLQGRMQVGAGYADA